jgi:hypothetical protein
VTSVTLRRIIHHNAGGKPEAFLADLARAISLGVNSRYARNMPDANSASTWSMVCGQVGGAQLKMWLEPNCENVSLCRPSVTGLSNEVRAQSLHEQFLRFVAQEQAFREGLMILAQENPTSSSVQFLETKHRFV